MKLIIKSFEELDPIELYRIIQARLEVFVVEQICPYLDLDDLDQEARHIWLQDQDVLVAYVRVVNPGVSYPMACSIGRVITQGEYRGSGYGRQIFEHGIEFCQSTFVGVPINISAQLYLKRFYSSFGFEQKGSIYLEDGIPHISMMRI